ncbi:MAG: hypothetical protein ACXAB2_05535 [Candidatus Hodarchaeales archaeon]|jgi:hypothetical protein
MQIDFNSLIQLKIPAYSGRSANNNKRIIECVATNGPLLKYGIAQQAGIIQYSTVSRRVDDLLQRKYLGIAGKKITERGRQSEEIAYGLTWRGFIASLVIGTVQENILYVVRVNPLLELPEKEAIIQTLEEIVTAQELQIIAQSLIEAYLRNIINLELDPIPTNAIMFFLAIRGTVLPDNFTLSKIPKDAWELLTLIDKPVILRAIQQRIIPYLKQKTIEMKTVYLVMNILNDFGDFLSKLHIENSPSTQVREYIEKRITPQLSEMSEQLEILENEENSL